MLGRAQRGDTLVEVLFAVAVFSFIVVGALSLMNQGTAAAGRSLEITLSRQQIDGQAETLRFLHDAYVANYQPGVTYDVNDNATTPAEEWYKVVQRIQATGAPSASTFGGDGQLTCPVPPSGSFVVDPRTARLNTNPNILQPAETWPQLKYADDGVLTASQGLWVEGIRSGTSGDAAQQNAGYIDFHIRVCWSAPGLAQVTTLGTIVRLYEPRG